MTTQKVINKLEDLIILQENGGCLYERDIATIREAREHLRQWLEHAEKWGTEIIDAKDGVRG